MTAQLTHYLSMTEEGQADARQYAKDLALWHPIEEYFFFTRKDGRLHKSYKWASVHQTHTNRIKDINSRLPIAGTAGAPGTQAFWFTDEQAELLEDLLTAAYDNACEDPTTTDQAHSLIDSLYYSFLEQRQSE